uniref:Uncharacterized protein n=1 Tax=Arundo donax TaxID=35708 RepID=A0A0A8YMW9_ARUDO
MHRFLGAIQGLMLNQDAPFKTPSLYRSIFIGCHTSMCSPLPVFLTECCGLTGMGQIDNY